MLYIQTLRFVNGYMQLTYLLISTLHAIFSKRNLSGARQPLSNRWVIPLT